MVYVSVYKSVARRGLFEGPDADGRRLVDEREDCPLLADGSRRLASWEKFTHWIEVEGGT